MLERLKRLLLGPADAKPAPDPAEDESALGFADLQIAAAALMIQAARQDGVLDDREADMIRRLLRARFALDAAEIDDLIESAAAKLDTRDFVGEATERLRQRLPQVDRVTLVDMLCEVACADGQVLESEQGLIDRVGGLLGVDQALRVHLMQQAAERARRRA